MNRLGITANYAGFHHTAYAVSLAYRQPDSLLLVTKRLYPDVARQYHTKWQRVERNIRTVIAIAWSENRPLLEKMLGIIFRAAPSRCSFCPSWYPPFVPARRNASWNNVYHQFIKADTPVGVPAFFDRCQNLSNDFSVKILSK